MKGFRVTKIVKEIRFVEVWGELQSRKSLQGQGYLILNTGYLRLTLVFVWSGAQWEGFDFYFSGVFC